MAALKASTLGRTIEGNCLPLFGRDGSNRNRTSRVPETMKIPPKGFFDSPVSGSAQRLICPASCAEIQGDFKKTLENGKSG
jgi:hypothetical protein